MEQKIQIPQFARQMLSNKEMEAAVLNGLMNEREGIDQAMQRLNDYCFYEPVHQVIYHAICNVYGANTPISMISVTNELMHSMDYEKAKDWPPRWRKRWTSTRWYSCWRTSPSAAHWLP